jgi:hypothetical protein
MYVSRDIASSQYRFLAKRSNLLAVFAFLFRVSNFPISPTPNERTCKWLMLDDDGDDKGSCLLLQTCFHWFFVTRVFVFKIGPNDFAVFFYSISKRKGKSSRKERILAPKRMKYF